MTFLVLESTGNLGVAGGALAASIATTLAVRATFGYSFTTWRLHLRGETIRGGQDVGWLRELTVGRMMAPAPPTFPADQSVRAFREAYPLGSANVVVAVGGDGRYQGLIHVPEAHALVLENGDDGGPIAASPICRRPSFIRMTTSVARSTSSAPPRPIRSSSPRAERSRCWGRSARPTLRAVMPRRRTWR